MLRFRKRQFENFRQKFVGANSPFVKGVGGLLYPEKKSLSEEIPLLREYRDVENFDMSEKGRFLVF